MVKGAPEVVDSIAYYDREHGGDAFNEANLNNWLAAHWIMLDAESVRLAQHKGFELPFKVRNVMLCSINL